MCIIDISLNCGNVGDCPGSGAPEDGDTIKSDNIYLGSVEGIPSKYLDLFKLIFKCKDWGMIFDADEHRLIADHLKTGITIDLVNKRCNYKDGYISVNYILDFKSLEDLARILDKAKKVTLARVGTFFLGLILVEDRNISGRGQSI